MKSPLNYLGGKSKLAKKIVPMIPSDHVCYCEPFCGAAWILFSKEPSKDEVINDADNELICFWRVIQLHLQPFLDYFKQALISRQFWEWENEKVPETLTDIQRAARYYYLQRLAFGGRTSRRTFGTTASGPWGLNLSTIEETLIAVHWRLKGVAIEHLDAITCITRYDRPSTFFYIDPPYFFNRHDYAVSFEKFDALSGILKGLKGRFILSLNDCKEVRELFSWATQKRVTLSYSCQNTRAAAGSRSKPRSELLIHNIRK
jgi:DNA adenine methylase